MLYAPKWEQQTEAQRILTRAADLIEMRGHAKHILKNDAGEMCLLGAILEAGRGKDWPAACRPVQQLLGTDNIAMWNNQPERTKAEAVAALRAAAQLR